MGRMSNMSVAIGWKIITSVSRYAVVLCLRVILVNAVSTAFAVIINFYKVVQDANYR